jgi:hypothetical protein
MGDVVVPKINFLEFWKVFPVDRELRDNFIFNIFRFELYCRAVAKHSVLSKDFSKFTHLHARNGISFIFNDYKFMRFWDDVLYLFCGVSFIRIGVQQFIDQFFIFGWLNLFENILCRKTRNFTWKLVICKLFNPFTR